RDYANIQQEYNNAVSNQGSAAAAERIEILSKGEKISVLDAAAVPDRPTKPNRTMIAAGGIAGGIFMGLAMVFLTELLNRSVRRPQDIINAFGITPMISIPYVRTPNETMRRRSVFVGLLLAAVIGIPLVIYAVHVYYQPLDIILKRVADNVGIRL
ncbi:MAG: GNVR domain-containing protein, partial [Paracoccaceae bacterium]